MNENEVEEDFDDVIDDDKLAKLIELKSELTRLLDKVDDLIEEW